MKRKRAKKLLMAKGLSRNNANWLLDHKGVVWEPTGKRYRFHFHVTSNARLVSFFR